MKKLLSESESEVRRKSQELAVAWRRGRYAFVLDSLTGKAPLEAALMATHIFEQLAKWDPYDCKWPNRFRHALLCRAHGRITAEEVEELESAYRQRFGGSPPTSELTAGVPQKPSEWQRLVERHVRRIRTALESGEPIVRRRSEAVSAFLRAQSVRQPETVRHE